MGYFERGINGVETCMTNYINNQCVTLTATVVVTGQGLCCEAFDWTQISQDVSSILFHSFCENNKL